MRPHQLLRLIQDDRPEATWLIPREGEWGVIEVLAVENGRLAGHAAVRTELDIEILAASAHETGRMMTETWVFAPMTLARVARNLLPVGIGVRVVSPQGRLGIVRPATVRNPPVTGWIMALSDLERVELAAILQCHSTTAIIEEHGLAKHGEDRLKTMLTEIYRRRASAPEPQRREFSPIEILRAVRHQFSQEKVIWL